MEEEIRGLGDQTSSGGHDFTCFAIPYWNWAEETSSNPVILNSGLGDNGKGGCVPEGPFSAGQYNPQEGDCLQRDWNYKCVFVSASSLMRNIVNSAGKYSSFLKDTGALPHGIPHICVKGQMLHLHSPDDPIFYLHHSFIDYQWSLWQSTYSYINGDGDAYSGDVDGCISYEATGWNSIAVRETFDLKMDYNAVYEKGTFWEMAHVEELGIIGDTDSAISWFIDIDDDENGENNESNEVIEDSKDLVYSQIIDDLMADIESDIGSGIGSDAMHKMVTPLDVDQRIDAVDRWAYSECIAEEERTGSICELPEIGYEDCSGMRVDVETGDIAMSLDEMLAKRGNTQCMKDTIGEFYEWAAHRGELKLLCAGCYDRFCDRTLLEGKCEMVGIVEGMEGSSGMQQVVGYHWRGWRDLSVSEIAFLAVFISLISAGICYKGMSSKEYETSYGYQEI